MSCRKRSLATGWIHIRPLAMAACSLPMAMLPIAMLPIALAACSSGGTDAPGTQVGPTLPTDPTQQPTVPTDVQQAPPDGMTPSGAPCTGGPVVAPKRLVRLSFNQIVNSVGRLLNPDIAAQISTTFQIGNPETRTFPPLASPREGATIADGVFSPTDQIAQAAAQYVFDNFAAVTGCTDAPTDACGQQFVTQFINRAFRRPATDVEVSRLLTTVYTPVLTAGGTVQEAVQYGVYAALESPHFLYRPELGGDPLTAGALAPYEFASQLAFFLTDAPPDEVLLQAAAAGQLATREQIIGQVDRIIATNDARINLQTAMFAYFGIATLDTIVIDSAVAPSFTVQLRASMRRETEEFLNYTLWNDSVQSLLTSRRSVIDQGLAAVYGVAFPPPGATPDATGFAVIDLPENRAGLLTQPGFLVTRSRPDRASVVGRGLLLNATILCGINPPFPEALQGQINTISAQLAGQTERELSLYRQTTAPCNACHPGFDPFGVALLNYDIIGQYITADAQGRPIDASTVLPPNAGGVTVANAVEMADQLATGSGAFAACLGSNLIRYSLAEGASVTVATCAAQTVAERFAANPDQSFTALVREVAASETFAMRAINGGTP